MRLGLLSGVALTLAALPAPACADTLVDHVNGITLDTEGHFERFTGLVITADGHIGQILRAYDVRPTKVQYAVDGKGAALIPGLVIGHIHLMEQALAAITPPTAAGRPLPPPRPEDRDLALATLQPMLLARGITAVADMGTTIEDWQSYRRAGDSGRLTIRIVGYAAGTANMALIGGPGPTPWLYEARLRLAGLYLDADAARPDRPNPIQLKNMISRAAIDHFQVAVRLEPIIIAGIGDALPPERFGEVTKAIAELSETYKGDRRWRIETVPAHLPLPDPLAHLPETVRPITLASYTADAAQNLFAEAQFGRIAPGLWADFVLLDADPLAINAPAPHVLESWVGGHRVYAAGEKAP